MSKYDKILFEILEKSKVREGVFIAMDGPLGPGISHSVSWARMPLFISALDSVIKTLRKALKLQNLSQWKK